MYFFAASIECFTCMNYSEINLIKFKRWSRDKRWSYYRMASIEHCNYYSYFIRTLDNEFTKCLKASPSDFSDPDWLIKLTAVC